MDPISLNVVRATATDVAVDTAFAAVAGPVVDIAGAAADARAALAGVVAHTAVVAADARATLAGAAADIAAFATAADSVGDLHRRACRVRRHCDLHVPRSDRSGPCFWL